MSILQTIFQKIKEFIYKKLQQIRQFIVMHIFADILALFLILFLILRIFVVDYTFVPSESMSNTIRTGDFVIFRKFSSSFLMGLPIIGKYLYKPNAYNYQKSMNTLNKIKRGDVILWTDGTNNYVKRVLALPGDIVQFNEFDVVVNGVSTMFQDPTEHTLFAEPVIVKMRHDDGVDEDVVKMRSQVMVNDDTATVFDVYFSYNYLMARQNAPYRVMRVPSNVVFIRGDNRDHSYDSACDGLFVKLDSIVGKGLCAVLGTKIRFGRYDANASWLNTALRTPLSIAQYTLNISPRFSNLQPVHKHVWQLNRVSTYEPSDSESTKDDAKPALPIINSEIITKSEPIKKDNADGAHHLMDYLNKDCQEAQSKHEK